MFSYGLVDYVVSQHQLYTTFVTGNVIDQSKWICARKHFIRFAFYYHSIVYICVLIHIQSRTVQFIIINLLNELHFPTKKKEYKQSKQSTQPYYAFLFSQTCTITITMLILYVCLWYTNIKITHIAEI